MINKIIDLIFTKDETNFELAFHLIQDKKIDNDTLLEYIKHKISDGEYLDVGNVSSFYNKYTRELNENFLSRFFDQKAVNFYKSLVDKDVEIRIENNPYRTRFNVMSKQDNYLKVELSYGEWNYYSCKSIFNTPKYKILSNEWSFEDLSMLTTQANIMNKLVKNINANPILEYYKYNKTNFDNDILLIEFTESIRDLLIVNQGTLTALSRKTKFFNTLKKGEFPILYKDDMNNITISSYNEVKNTCSVNIKRWKRLSYNYKKVFDKEINYKNRNVDLLYNNLINFIKLE